MKREHEDSLMYPPLEELRRKIPQKYELVLAATRRAKQIIREQRLNPLGIPSDDKHKKPLSIALGDIVEGKVDKQSLMAPDIVFDEYEEDQLDSFPEFEHMRKDDRDFSAEAEGEDSYIDEETDADTEETEDEFDFDAGFESEEDEEL